MNYRWYFLGSGHMAKALMQGLIGAGIQKQQIFACSLTGRSSKNCEAELGVTHLDSLPKLSTGTICVLAMKPQQFQLMNQDNFASLDSQSIVLSLMAGVDISTIQHKTQARKVIRHMPNLAVAHNAQGASSALSETMEEGERVFFEQLFKKLGHHTLVEHEQLITDSTVHCSSMLAHHFEVAHLIAMDLERSGYSAEEAKKQAIMTFQSAATQMIQSNLSLLQLKEMVVSKAGVTYAFLKSLEENNFAQNFTDALKAGQARAHELQNQFKE